MNEIPCKSEFPQIPDCIARKRNFKNILYKTNMNNMKLLLTVSYK
ncbi:hypothetical protein Cst_c19660 [Thermoclostridium stercorarium subsp. stercorarium DSM 8532]|uniref:Uncharacterized protein n=1 Tax=Thermoclostridium stercorarium (strain ATCC 35414 / DSM 8532 / NCIMB 11754) TaxID=1121335 RepID=L7VRA9_THES1|nr:hypothetical protein Cst_c19660 [Thermoclostridium stercorarium subsp. stercorarium DSM 8532]